MTTKRLKKTSGSAGRPAAGKRSPASEPDSKRAQRANRTAKSSPSNGIGGTRAPARRPPAPVMPVDEKQVAAIRNFEAGLGFERRQNYRKAREIFEKVVATAPLAIADRARVHLNACNERLGANAPTPKTAGDFHVLGVAELNSGRLELAVEHLSKAQKLDPKREEIRYALAAAYARSGDSDEALEHLRAAIHLRPQNRFQARQDADFENLAGDPRFTGLLGHEYAVNRRSA